MSTIKAGNEYERLREEPALTNKRHSVGQQQNGAYLFPDVETFGFRIGKRLFFVPARRSRDCAEAYIMYAAQAIPQIDTAGAEKSPFRTETN